MLIFWYTALYKPLMLELMGLPDDTARSTGTIFDTSFFLPPHVNHPDLSILPPQYLLNLSISHHLYYCHLRLSQYCFTWELLLPLWPVACNWLPRVIFLKCLKLLHSSQLLLAYGLNVKVLQCYLRCGVSHWRVKIPVHVLSLPDGWP